MNLLTLSICGIVAMAIVLHMSGAGPRLSLTVAIATMTLAMLVALWRERRGGGKSE